MVHGVYCAPTLEKQSGPNYNCNFKNS